MAPKRPECGTVAHARTSAYEAHRFKRSWYQCQNLECSAHLPLWKAWIRYRVKPWRMEQESDSTNARKTTANSQPLWLRVKAVKPSANSCLISKIRPRSPGPVPGFTPFPPRLRGYEKYYLWRMKTHESHAIFDAKAPVCGGFETTTGCS